MATLLKDAISENIIKEEDLKDLLIDDIKSALKCLLVFKELQKKQDRQRWANVPKKFLRFFVNL